MIDIYKHIQFRVGSIDYRLVVMSSKYGRTEKGDTIGYGFVRKMTIFGDAPPSTRKEQFVGQAGELVGIGLFDPPQIFVTNGRTAL